MLRLFARWRVATALLLVGCVQAAPEEPTTPAKPLRAAVSSALLPFVKEAAALIHGSAGGPEPRVEEARNSLAIRKLIDGQVGMAFTSRALRDAELGEGAKKARALHMVVVGAEALAVIVHRDNPLQDISSEQLRKVFFTGEISDWSELTGGTKQGPIHVLALTSATGELFASSIAGDDKKPFVEGAKLAEQPDSTVTAVDDDMDAISFTGLANLTPRVRAVMLDNVAPDARAVLDNSYVLNRKLFAISDGPPTGSGREFIKFLLSATGQNIAKDNGVTPITLD